MRFAGTKNNRIVIVSDKKFENNNYKIIKVPEDLNDISDIDLLSNYKVHNDELVAKHSKKNINELKLAFIVEVSSEIYQWCSFISFSPGHYMCYVRGTDTHWYNINDNIVTKIATKDILEIKEIFVCFYQKTTTPFFDAQISNLREIQGF